MENLKQQTANQFWEAHFSDLVGSHIDEQHALDIQFWDTLQTALGMADMETVHAIIYTKPAISVSTGETYLRIVKMAKRVWDKRRM